MALLIAGLTGIREELCRAGEEPAPALLDRVKAHGQAVVPLLIEIAIDDDLHNADSESPKVWAPLHAIQLLGEMGASEAVEPLLPLLDWVDDDWLDQVLPEAFGGMGAPALAPLRAVLFDRTRDVWARARAADSLCAIGQHHVETRSGVVSVLVERLDPGESQVPDDETVNACVINALLDLKAAEAASAIVQAFDEDRVDTSIVDFDCAVEDLDLLPASPLAGPERTGLRLWLRCTACGYTRLHDIPTVYYDLGTVERRQRGEQEPYSEVVIPQRILCQKCGAVDRYEMTSLARITLAAELLKRVAFEIPQPEAALAPGPVRLMYFGLADGRKMHPLAARDLYRRKLAAEPRRAGLRVGYGNVLSLLGYRDEAGEQYRVALRLEPANLDAHLNLGRLAWVAGDLTEARGWFERLLEHTRDSRLPLETRVTYDAEAREELAVLARPPEDWGPLEWWSYHIDPASHADPPAPSTQARRKPGRNDPCPCGSARKYKKCHGR